MLANWFTRGALALAFTVVLAGVALASDFDGWSVRKITHDKRFVKSSYSLSMARNGGGPKAKLVYHWIGYIPQSDATADGTRVYFDSKGEGITCVKWAKTGEWIPKWVEAALSKLTDEGYIEVGPGTGGSTPATSGGAAKVEGRG